MELWLIVLSAKVNTEFSSARNSETEHKRAKKIHRVQACE